MGLKSRGLASQNIALRVSMNVSTPCDAKDKSRDAYALSSFPFRVLMRMIDYDRTFTRSPTGCGNRRIAVV